MLHHIYRSNIGVLGHGQHAFQRCFSFKSKTREGAPFCHQPQDASRSLLWPVINNPVNCLSLSDTVRYKSATLDKPQCSHPGCSNYVSRRGLCRKHAYPDSRRCSRPGCTNKVHSRGLCKTHRYPCAIEGCEKQVNAGGYCKTHAKEHDRDAYDMMRSDTSCDVDGCEKQAKAGGYCSEHAQQDAQGAYREFRLRVNKSKADRLESDLNFKLGEQLRKRMNFELSRVGISYKGKLTLIGCSVDQLRQYFEHNYFQEEGNEWMSWENWGGKRCNVNRSWELDHIMPVSSFDLTDQEEVNKCFHWSNLQPLEWQKNMEKGDSIPKDFEWCYVKERWMWSEASGKINYELPPAGEEDSVQ